MPGQMTKGSSVGYVRTVQLLQENQTNSGGGESSLRQISF